MSKKKCKLCCEDATWKLDGDYYCEFCVRSELDVHGFAAPRICEMCGDHLDRVYYTDSEDNAFCSPKCALEFHGAEKLEEEQEDNVQEEEERK